MYLKGACNNFGVEGSEARAVNSLSLPVDAVETAWEASPCVPVLQSTKVRSMRTTFRVLEGDMTTIERSWCEAPR